MAAQNSIFGPGADEIQRQIQEEKRSQLMQEAQIPAGRMAVYAAGQAGDMLGTGLSQAAGWQDPRVKSAQLMQDAANEVNSTGLSLLENPQDYYKATYVALSKRGLNAEAAKVHEIMVSQAQAAAKAETDNLKARGAYLSGVAAYEKSQNGEFVTTDNGRVTTNKKTGEIQINEGVPQDYKSASFAPPGNSQKGQPGQVTVDVSTAEGQAKARELLAKGYQDVKSLPGPRNDININQFDNLANKIAEPSLKEVFSRGQNAANIITQAQQSNDLLTNGNAPVGLGASIIGVVGKAMDFFGVDKDTQNALNANPSDQAALDSLHKQMIGSLARQINAGSAKVSAKELQMMERAGPSIWTTKAGQYLINSLMIENAKVDLAAMDQAASLFKDEKYSNNAPGIVNAVTQWKAEHGIKITKDMLENINDMRIEAERIGSLPAYTRASPKTGFNKEFVLDGHVVYYQRWNHKTNEPMFSAVPGRTQAPDINP